MSSELDILSQLQNIDLSTVETSFPLLASGIVTAQVQECEFKRDTDKKGDSAKPYCWIKCSLTQPWQTVSHEGVESKPVSPGFPITKRVYVGTYVDKEGKTKWYGLDELARFRESAYGPAPQGQKFVPAEMLGQNVVLRLAFDPSPKNDKTGQVYGPQTTIAGYVRKAK